MKKSQLFISFVKPDFKVIQSKRVFDKAGTCIFAGAFLFFENCDLNKLPTDSRKSLTVNICCFIIKTDQWSKMSNGNKRTNREPGEDMKNRANMKKEGK